MRDPSDILELAKSYRQGELTGEELQNTTRCYALPVVERGVNCFARDFGSQEAAICVLVAELPLIMDGDGRWKINRDDERVADFPPE